MPHIPVLLDKVLEYSKADLADKIIDGTAGDGGYIQEFLKANETVKVLGIDLDQTSLDKLGQKLAQSGLSQRCTLLEGNFRDLAHIAKSKSFVPTDVVILDLGFSSSQLDDSSRGLSFQVDGPLDMRFSSSAGKTAADVINNYQQHQLEQIFKDYGEERLAGKIAREIVLERSEAKISGTSQLFEIIKKSLPKPVAYKASDYARRIFQALRIEVNDELENLKHVLPDILDVLAPAGRMLIISFHSLEDRIVKQFFSEQAKGCVCPPDFPYCVCGKNPNLKILTKKPIVASEEEIKQNSRSKPAKMRVAQKYANRRK